MGATGSNHGRCGPTHRRRHHHKAPRHIGRGRMVLITRLGSTNRNSSSSQNGNRSHRLRPQESGRRCSSVPLNRNLAIRTRTISSSGRGHLDRDNFSTRNFCHRLSSARYGHRGCSAVARSSIHHNNPPDPLAGTGRYDLRRPLRHRQSDGLSRCVSGRIDLDKRCLCRLIRNRAEKNFLGSCLNRHRPRGLTREVRVGNRGRDRICAHSRMRGITPHIGNGSVQRWRNCGNRYRTRRTRVILRQFGQADRGRTFGDGECSR